MPDYWSIAALVLVAWTGGFVAGGVALVVGGVGGMFSIQKRVDHLEDGVDRIDAKITREVKTRAGLAASEKRSAASVQKEARDIKDAAPDWDTGPLGQPKRPSVVRNVLDVDRGQS